MIPRSRATNPSFHEKRAALHEPLDCRPREKRECSRGKRYVEERGQGWQECWDEKIHGCGSGCTWSKAWIILFACFCWPLSTKREFFDGSWIMSTGSGLGLAKKWCNVKACRDWRLVSTAPDFCSASFSSFLHIDRVRWASFVDSSSREVLFFFREISSFFLEYSFVLRIEFRSSF